MATATFEQLVPVDELRAGAVIQFGSHEPYVYMNVLHVQRTYIGEFAAESMWVLVLREYIHSCVRYEQWTLPQPVQITVDGNTEFATVPF